MSKVKQKLNSLARAAGEFFHPKAWIPTFPIPKKHNPSALGYMSLMDAIKGFPEKKK